MVSLLAVTWVLLTSHCKIEAIAGFEFLRCASDLESHASPENGGDPCDDAGCCAVESAQYHAPRHHDLTPTPLTALSLAPQELFHLAASAPSLQIRPGLLTTAPPDLPASWRFFFRTALPVRAPSPAS